MPPTRDQTRRRREFSEAVGRLETPGKEPTPDARAAPLSPATLAARIRAERDRLGLTQSEAARRLGWVRQRYVETEAGRNVPGLGKLLALVALGMDARALVPELCGPLEAAPGPKAKRPARPPR